MVNIIYLFVPENFKNGVSALSSNSPKSLKKKGHNIVLVCVMNFSFLRTVA